MTADFFGITDKGKRREKNEDAFVVKELFNKEYVLACVIDGVGGYSGGDVAAKIASEVISKYFENKPGDVVAVLKDAITAVNTRINTEKLSGTNYQQMACVITCAVVHLPANKLYYAHVGDTRLYLFRDKNLVKITKDHSVVGYLEETGRLSEEDAMNHPRRNEINKALGFEAQIAADDFIETGESPFLPGDLILLCSDGLTDMISSQTISNILNTRKPIQEKSRELIHAANEAGGNDNITAILVANHNQPKKQFPVAPAERERKTSLNKPHFEQAAKNKTVKKSRLPLVLFLAGSASILLGMLTPQFKNMLANEITDVKKSNVRLLKPENVFFVNLLSAANDSSNAFSLPSATLLFNQTIVISKDTFYIKGNGTVFSPDSNFIQPALFINAKARAVILDSIVFKDFDVAIVAASNNLVLKNVRFINCPVPIQYNLSFRDSLVSGKIKDSVFNFN